MIKLVNDAKSISDKGSLKPILFIGQRALFDLLDSNIYQYNSIDEKLPFELYKQSNSEQSYVCHISGIEVHTISFSNFGFNLLLPIEIFQTINILRYGDGHYVNVTFNTETPESSSGTLSFEFNIKCVLNTQLGYKYILDTRES